MSEASKLLKFHRFW